MVRAGVPEPDVEADVRARWFRLDGCGWCTWAKYFRLVHLGQMVETRVLRLDS
jgi:hypothetical protein